jgi:endonuclease/exonuclease/phosphatase family metal-dependent hydrolase
MSARKYLLMLAALAACREPAELPADASVGVDASPVSPHPGELWVMCWNLQTFPKAVSTPAHVAQLLGGTAADVVGVEEIQEQDAFADLDARLPDYEGVLASNGDGYSRVGLLYRPGSVQVDQVQTLFLGDADAFPRPPLAAHVVGQGVELTVVVVHLKAQGDATSEARRRDAVRKLETWMSARPDQRVIVIGDWNDEVTDVGAENVFAPLLDKADAYTVLTLPLAQAGESTYIPFPSFIDHMVMTDNALPEWGGGATFVLHLDETDSVYRQIVSDHRPVLTKFHPAP